MRRIFIVALLIFGIGIASPIVASAYNFGDYRSVTLTSKAWEALNAGDIEAVLAYTNKCKELYGEQAKKMQAALTDYAKGANEEIFKNWALNDIATCLFIQGEAYRKAKMNDEAKGAYQELIANYKFGQCWDVGGWFWKPAEAAAERLDAIDKGIDVDFGDMKSSTLTTKAWEAYSKDDLEGVLTYTNKCISLYGAEAKKMQAALTDYAKGANEEIFKNWALNDVAACFFIQGEAYRKNKMMEEAKAAYQEVVSNYKFGQCWDVGGWFWKPAEAAAEKLDAIKKGIDTDFGDMKSSTLTTKAWEAYSKDDLEGVLTYTNKCISLYGAEAKKMQAALTDYAKGANEEIFKNWALNDVATCLFIQGEAYRKNKMMEEAKAAYQEVVSNYKFGQCWDVGGWFWKPAEAAAEKLDAIKKGIDTDFGDMKSSTLTTKAWEAYNKNDLEGVLTYTNKCIATYGEKAKEMQASLTEYPWENNEKIFSYWALNDVGTCIFIQGDAYKKANKLAEAKAAFEKVAKEYYFAQCWDAQGWFWKPSEAADQRLQEIKEMQ